MIIFQRGLGLLCILFPFLLNAQRESLGSSINTSFKEILPVITPDGKSLYFGRAGADGEDIDIWYSELGAGGKWKKPVHMGEELNNTSDNCVNGVTADNNNLLLLDNYSGTSNLYSIAQRTADGWTDPSPVEFGNREYKAKGMVSATISSDGQVIIVEINIDGSYGENDLYISFKQNDGSWSALKNLGRKLNSENDDSTPFLAPDMKTLYFSSDRPGGFGGLDIYITRRLDDSWTNWSAPENLGSTINTEGADFYFFIPASGEYAYFSSSPNGPNNTGDTDLFRIKLPKNARPDPTVIVSGKVFNKKTNQPIAARILYESLSKKQKPAKLSTDPKSGIYKIALPKGDRYGIYASADGFFPVSENLDLTALEAYSELEKNLYLVPVEAGETVLLNNLFFDFAKWDLRENSYPELDRVFDMLSENENMEIEIQGHTDNVGSTESNLKLSRQRAASVKDYLIEKGISLNRITSKGFGESKPIATNNTDDGRQKNRRVEFRIVKN